MMWTYTAMGTFVLVLTLATIFVMIMIVRQQRTQKDLPIWLMSGLVGMLLGAGGAAAAVQLLGYEMNRVNPSLALLRAEGQDPEAVAESLSMPGTPGGMSMGGPPGGGGGMGGPPGGGGFTPSPKQQLTTLVRKLELLTGDIALQLSDEQSASLALILTGVRDADTMSDEEAEAAYNQLQDMLTDEQKSKEQAVGLPRGGRGGFGGGGGSDDESANPFHNEQNIAALTSLIERIGAAESPAPAADEAAETETSEQPADQQ